MSNEIERVMEELEAGLHGATVLELADDTTLDAFSASDAYGYAKLRNIYYCKVAEAGGDESRMFVRNTDGAWLGL